mgnify:FL=1|tara:strand:+ start:716 stop:1033 length:318 start_codon:yes stop_codon:yes gene_type:complete
MLSASSGRSHIFNHRGDIISEITVDADDSIVLSQTQDANALAEFCKFQRNNAKHNYKSNMRPLAEIPVTVFNQALSEGWAHDSKQWKKWLNDPANRGFRTSNLRA